MKAFIESKKN